MNISNTDQEKLETLRRTLRRHYGSIEEIRKRSAPLNAGKPFHRSYVVKVLQGTRNNSGLLALAAEVANELEAERMKHLQKIDAAVSALA